jgi:N6-L-threonylcarbamoyladenine synthase
LASREHQRNIVPVVDHALKEAGISRNQLDAVAFTEGPGLLGSLLVGSSFAKTFALSLDIPLISVNHMQAHILAHFIEQDDAAAPEFPFLCLTVSGGHTQIVLVEEPLRMKVLGKTIDDAAGEAFDKAAKILNLGYPGGPIIDKLASEGDSFRFQFATPNIKDLDFSFSGIKTSFLYKLQKAMKADDRFIQNNLSDICASYQHHIVTYLLSKLKEATKIYSVQDIALAGGVSANSELRKRFHVLAEDLEIRPHIPKFEFCTDNAAMIGMAAQFKFKANEFEGFEISSKPRLYF